MGKEEDQIKVGVVVHNQNQEVKENKMKRGLK